MKTSTPEASRAASLLVRHRWDKTPVAQRTAGARKAGLASAAARMKRRQALAAEQRRVTKAVAKVHAVMGATTNDQGAAEKSTVVTSSEPAGL